MTKPELYEQLILSLPDGVLVVDSRGVIELANPGAADMFGYSCHEMYGMNVDMLVPTAVSVTHHQSVHQYMQQPKKRAMGAGKRLSGQHKDGSSFPASISLSPVELDGEIKVIASVRDMGDFEALERQFEQAQKMEEVGSLAAGISHDFNNVLASITCQTYLIRCRLADHPELTDELINIEKQAFEAADLIRQLLAFARKSPAKAKRLPLRSLIKEALRLHTSTLPSSITVHVNICPERLMVQADPMQLQQVFLNLLNNAKHAMYNSPEQQLRISLQPFIADALFLKAHPDLRSAKLACLSVSDSGHGIAEDQLKQIFEPFFTTKEAGHGTGLGLSMIANAIQQCGGAIGVQSSVGDGSIFSIYLPLDINEEDVAEESRQIISGEGETILLVDDNEAARNAIGRLLVELNYQVIEASDGAMAVEHYALHASQIDLVIMDVVMPIMGGLEAARWIRRTNPAMPILFATAYDYHNVEGVLRNSLALSKPVPIHKLSQGIRQLVQEIAPALESMADKSIAPESTEEQSGRIN